MSTRLVALIATVAVLEAMRPAAQQPATPSFRSAITVVTVNVSVRSGKKPVLGLTAADFAVLDNAVPQRVSRVTYETVPIDVTLLVDVSGSMAPIIDQVRKDAASILALVRAGDRARVLAIDSYVHEILPLQDVSGAIALPRQPAVGGLTSLRDALNVALITRADPDRRRLVVAITDGADTFSVGQAPGLLEVARRSDSVLYVIRSRSLDPARSLEAMVAGKLRGRPQTLTYNETNNGIESAAVTTGGAYLMAIPTDDSQSSNPVREFQSVFDTFRQSYVIQYSPEGVSSTGWHELAVKVKGVKDDGVRARKGYVAAGEP